MRVVVFMTYGVSLEDWRKAGILDRETALYKKIHESGIKVTFITYGGQTDNEIVRRIGFIDLAYNKYNLPTKIYVSLLSFLHRKVLKDADLFKTNQLSGSAVALLCSKCYKKPLIVRQGFSLYEFKTMEKGKYSLASLFIRWYENKIYKYADALVFSTPRMLTSCLGRHRIDTSKAFCIPNYVDVDMFLDRAKITRNYSRLIVGYLGRLVSQKNLENLIIAAAGLPVDLVIIGDGNLDVRLRSLASSHSVPCQFLGRMDQKKAIAVLHGCDCFVLPSMYEGHPKALLEAMALGMPVLGSRVPGIEDEIQDKVTGLLVSPTERGLRTGLKNIIGMSTGDRLEMGNAARACIFEKYSLNKILVKELDLFGNLTR